MLSASSEVDLRLLYEHFDLDAFDWLMEPEGYDALRDAASRAVQDRQYPRLVPTRSETAEQRGAAGEQEMAGAREAPKGPLRGVQSTEHAGQLVGELSVITEGSADFSSGSPPRVSKDFSAVAREESAGGGAGEEEAAEMSPEEEAAAVRGSMVDMCARGEAAEASAVAVTMLCIRAGWEHVGLDLLRGLFAAFPGKMYAAVTLPHESNQPALLDMFSR